MGGLFVATFLTLLFLPALYSAWFRKQIRAETLAANGGGLAASGQAAAARPVCASPLRNRRLTGGGLTGCQ